MTARFILGRSGYGKTEKVLNEIVSLTEKNEIERILLIVPEQFTFQMELELSKRYASGGMIKAEVLSFTRLAHKILKETGGLANVMINNEGKNMILRKIINKNRENFQVFKNVSAKEGFISKISAVISEFKRAGILPHMIPFSNDNLLSRKLSDIFLIYKLFNEYLEKKYIDTDDFINLFIMKAEKSNLIKNSVIFIDSFSNFNMQEYRVIDRLLRYARECVFSISLDLDIYNGKKNAESGVFNATEKTYEKLCLIVSENKYQVINDIVEIDGSKRNEMIRHLETTMFMKNRPDTIENNKSIFIKKYSNMCSEVDGCAQEILDLARENGYRWREIVVICNDLNEYSGELRRAFDRRSIPYFIDEKRAVTENRAVDYMITILKCRVYNYEYETMFRYLKSGFSGIDYDEIETLENYVLKYNIKGYQWKNNFVYGDEETVKTINLIREKAMIPLLWLENEMASLKTAFDFAEKYYEFLMFIGMFEKLTNWAENLNRKGELLYQAEVEQLWDISMNILDQIAEILNDDELTYEEFVEVLETGFSSCEIGNIPATIDQLIVGNMQRIRHYNSRAIFVIGANEGIIPLDRKNTGLLSDEEKELIKTYGIDIGYDKWIVEDEETFGIYSNLTKPKERLTISWPEATLDGNELKQSEIIEQIISKFSNLKIENGLAISENIYDKKSLKYSYLYEMGKVMKKTNEDKQEEETEKLEVIYQILKELGEKIDLENRAINESPKLSEEVAFKIWGDDIRASISRLETFSACRFMYFIKYGLRAQEREKFEVGNAEIGEFMHQIIEGYERYVENLPKKWDEIKTDECIGIVENIADIKVKEYLNGIFENTSALQVLYQRIKRVVSKFCYVLTDNIKRGKFRPIGYEIGFGPGRDIPPIKIPLDKGNLLVEGRIDRADVFENEKGEKYLFVLDYKSGSKDLKTAEIYHGLQMQLLVYLSLATEYFGAEPAGAYYFRIEDYLINSAAENYETEIREKYRMTGFTLKNSDVVRAIDKDLDGKSQIIPAKIKEGMVEEGTNVFSMEELNKTIEFVKNKACSNAKEILNGKIDINPYNFGNKTPCEFCLYKEICRFDTNLNTYRYLRDIKKEEFFEIIGK